MKAVWLLFFLITFIPGYKKTLNESPTGLMIEFIREPEQVLIADPKPEFSWIVHDNAGTQTAYQILVSSSKELLSRDFADLWNGIKTIRYHKILLPVEPERTSYVLAIPPDSRNTGPAAVHLPDSIGVITPFRYCELENCRFELNPENLRQKALWYYFENGNSAFISSDTVLNKVWDISKYTIKATSFTGLYIDGDRERIPYEADAYINQLGHYYTDRELSLARRTNEYFIEHPTWPTEWILQTVLMFYNDLMYTGNPESVSQFYKELKYKTLFEIARPDGLISSKNITDEIMTNLGFSNAKERIRDIVDWPPSQKDTGWQLATSDGERDGYDMAEVITVVNAFHYRSWWNMIRSGSTMTMEAWDMKYKPNSDWNHAWGAAPANMECDFIINSVNNLTIKLHPGTNKIVL